MLLPSRCDGVDPRPVVGWPGRMDGKPYLFNSRQASNVPCSGRAESWQEAQESVSVTELCSDQELEARAQE